MYSFEKAYLEVRDLFLQPLFVAFVGEKVGVVLGDRSNLGFGCFGHR